MAASTGSADRSNSSALLEIEFQKGLAWRGLKQARFYQMVSKNTQFSARSKERTIQISPGRGTGSNFTQALAKRGPGSTFTFTLTNKNDYTIGSIDCALLETNDKDRIADALLQQLKLKGYEHGLTISRKYWSGEGGQLGELKASSSISTKYAYLTTRADAFNFYPGQLVMFASDNGTGTSPSGQRVGTLEVAAVEPENTTAPRIEFTTNVVAGIPAADDGDHVFADGDYALSWSGVPGWAPKADPSSSESFLGVDRTTAGDLVLAAGLRYTSESGSDMDSIVNNALAAASDYNIEVEYLFCNSKDIASWKNTHEGMNESRDVQTKIAGVSFKGIVVHTGDGDVTVVSEARVPQGYAWGTSMDIWTQLSQGDVPHFTTTGGEKLHLESTADARQFRLVSRMCLDNEDPGKTVVIAW